MHFAAFCWKQIGVFGDIKQFIIADFGTPSLIRDPYTKAKYNEVSFVGCYVTDTALPAAEVLRTKFWNLRRKAVDAAGSYPRRPEGWPPQPTALPNANTAGTRACQACAVLFSSMAGRTSDAAGTEAICRPRQTELAQSITRRRATAVKASAKKILATLTSATDTDVIVVNGTSYIRGTGWANSAALIVLLNARGDCIATAADEVVTIIAKDGYALTVAAASGDEARVVITTLQTIVTVEVSEHAVNVAGGFNFVAPKVTMAGSGYAQVTAILEMDSRPDSMGNVGAKYPA